LGIDPIIPLRDFAELPAAQAIDVIEWAARTLVRSVVDDVWLGRSGLRRGDGGSR
jgi:hypothetical protein